MHKKYTLLYCLLLLCSSIATVSFICREPVSKFELLTREEWTFKQAVFPATLTKAEQETALLILELYSLRFSHDGTLHTLLTREALEKGISFSDVQDRWQFTARHDKIICDPRTAQEELLIINRLDDNHLVFTREFERHNGLKVPVELHYVHE